MVAAAPKIQTMLTDGKSPDRPSSPEGNEPAGQLPLETFLAEWAFEEFCPSKCKSLHEEHPLAYAKSRMVDLADALRKAGYAK